MIERYFKLILTAANVPVIRFNDFRHTAVAIMLSHGIPIFVVSKYIGNARLSITSDIYGHLVINSMDGIGDTMDELILRLRVT
jgi:integrase